MKFKILLLLLSVVTVSYAQYVDIRTDSLVTKVPLRFRNLNEGSGKVLTSDNLGNATWQHISSITSNWQVVGTNNTIKNNVVFGGISSTTLGNIFNNIIFPGSTAALSFPNESNVYNNVCVGCAGTPSFNNVFTTAANTVFQVAEPRILDDLWDERFKLSVSSPAKAKGVAGVDCGVFAGTNPYVLSSIPPFPMITAFTQGAPLSGNIPITISIKRN